jgi:hypothetical protein
VRTRRFFFALRPRKPNRLPGFESLTAPQDQLLRENGLQHGNERGPLLWRGNQQTGAEIMRKAIQSPARQVADNAGCNGASWWESC